MQQAYQWPAAGPSEFKRDTTSCMSWPLIACLLALCRPCRMLPQAEVTLYLVSSAALGGYLASAALFVLSGALTLPSPAWMP